MFEIDLYHERPDKDIGTVGLVLKSALKPWRQKCWCIPPKQNAAFVAAMEDVLEVYQRPSDDS